MVMRNIGTEQKIVRAGGLGQSVFTGWRDFTRYGAIPRDSPPKTHDLVTQSHDSRMKTHDEVAISRDFLSCNGLGKNRQLFTD
jgi:hypothetical protein